MRIILFCMLMLSSEAALSGPDTVTGVWLVEGSTQAYGPFRFFTRFETSDAGNVTATKLNASPYVPQNQVHLRGLIQGDILQADVQVAFPGFDSPEWKRHHFALQRSDEGAITRLTLSDGTEHIKPDGSTFNDQWNYTPWPGSQLYLSLPKINDRAYQLAKNDASSEIADTERSLARYREEQAANIDEASVLKHAFDAQQLEVDRLATAYDAAWQRYANRRYPPQAQPQDEIPDDFHPRLRGSYETLRRNLADIERLEGMVLDHQNGVNRLNNDAIASIFSNIDDLKSQNEIIREAIRLVSEELGITTRMESETPQQRRASLQRLEADADEASDRLLDAQKALARISRDHELISGRVEHQVGEIARLETGKIQLSMRQKLLDRERKLARIEAAADRRLVYEAIPSALRADILGLKEQLDTVRDLLGRTTELRRDFKSDYMEVFNELTGKNEYLRWLQWRNALKMAAAEAGSKIGELALSFATGGPAGLAVEIITTPILQFLLHEDGVVFSNYDETNLRQAFHQAHEDQENGLPDPQSVCDLTNTRLSEAVTTLFDPASVPAEYGNVNQRLSDIPNHAVSTLLNTTRAAAEHAGTRMHYRGSVEAGRQRLYDLVGARIEAAHLTYRELDTAARENLARRISSADRLLMHESTSIGERRAALRGRQEMLGRLANDSGPGASRVVTSVQQEAAGLLDAVEAAEATMRSSTDETAVAAARTAREESLSRLRAILPNSVAAVDSVAEINWSSAVSHYDELVRRVAAEEVRLRGLRVKLSDARNLRKAVGGSAASIAFSLATGLARSWYQNELQEAEREIWSDIFLLQMQQALRYRAWMQASCAYWAVTDIYNDLSRQLYRLWAAYDPESGFHLARNNAFRDYESLRVSMVYEPPVEMVLETRVGGHPCRQQGSTTACRIPAGALQDASGPYFELDIGLIPPGGN
ncbi:hypothetical protein [Solemya velum gill symbiont]|uniref:hypothetical protein n=1 Tax=Solemya velum gill symbiont TaxID=2340 RepID=UPI00099682A1|nr:hypothetical protein [Solemya velum gill symbiont]OOZ13269.1 hypothetical protein BOW25_05570 [Solemya velum gill symbiont]